MKKHILTFYIFSILLITRVIAQYRFKEAAQLTILPDQIKFMNDQILFKEGMNVELRSTTDYASVIRSFKLPSEQSTVAVLPSSEQIIFSTLTGISKSAKTRPQTKITLSTTNHFQQDVTSFLTITSRGESFIIPPIIFSKQLSIINSTDYSISQLSMEGNYSYDVQVRSQVIASDQTYYFTNGLHWSNQKPQQQQLYFFQGKNNSYQNVFNFTIPIGEKFKYWYPKQYLRKIIQNNQSYFLMAQQNYTSLSKFICQIIEKNDQTYSSLGVSQQIQTYSLQLIDKNTIVYFTPSCEIMQTYASQWVSNILKRQAIDKSLVITSSADDSILVGFSSSVIFNNMYIYAYLLKLNQNQTYTLASTLPQNTGGLGFKSCTFFKDNSFIAVYEGTNQTGYSQLSFYSISKSAYIQAFLYEVDDYSICPNSNNLFIRTNGTIMLYSLENDTITLIAKGQQSIIATLNFTCGWDDSIFISFGGSSNSFQKWELVDNNLIKTASFKRDSRGAFTLKAIFKDSLMFKGLSIGIYFYDYNLNSFQVPFNEYKYIQVNEVKGNLVIFANNYASTATQSILYEYSNRSLVYKGTYPVTIGRQAIRRRIILANSRQIYVDYYNSATSNYQSIKFKVDAPPFYRKGYIYNDQNATKCTFIRPFITKSLQMVVLERTPLGLTKYSLTDNLSLKDTVALESFSTVSRFKVSTTQTYVCIWGKSITVPKNNYVQARLMSNLSIILYQKQLLGLASGENILDCEVNENQTTAIATYQINTNVNLYLFENGFKDVKTDSSLSSVTVLAVCQQDGVYAYTGIDSETSLPSPDIIIDSFTVPSSSKISTGCQVKQIVFGKICDSFGYVCADNTLNVYSITSKSIIFTQNFAESIIKFQILSSSKLLITFPTSVKIIDYSKYTEVENIHNKLSDATANTSIAIDYNRELIAYSPDLKTITITDFFGKVIETIKNKDGFDVTALVFKSTGQLYVSLNGITANSASSLVIWINEPCPQNQTLTNSYCLCSNTYHLVNGSCICLNNQIVVSGLCGCPNNLSLINDFCSCKNNLIIKNNYCVCPNNLVLLNDSCGCSSNLVLKDGFCKCENNLVLINNTCGCTYKSEVRNNKCYCKGGLALINQKCQCESGYVETTSFDCEECSFTCSECSDGGAFSCKQFSAWFYVIISAGSLLIIGTIVIVLLKIKRKRANSSQLQTNLSESKQGELLNQQKE